MDAPEPIKCETPNPELKEINFIEELVFNKENEEYNIKLGFQELNLIIKVINLNSDDIYYYQKNFSIFELQKLSQVFSAFKNIKEIITFLKNLIFEIQEINGILIIKFILSQDKNQFIELNLNKYLPTSKDMIKFLLKEMKSIRINNKKEKNKTENEIKELKESISELKEENKKLNEDINKLNKIVINSNIIRKLKLDSKIIKEIISIYFILDYLLQNDDSLNLKNIKLLFRASKDGNKTKTCHKLCDNKEDILIIILSDNGYIFGGYSKIGFKTNNDPRNFEYKIDNNCFLFSVNLEKIYAVIKNKEVICHIRETSGLNFYSSLVFHDNFMNRSDNCICKNIKEYFNGLEDEYEMNGGKDKFKCKELEVFQLL